MCAAPISWETRSRLEAETLKKAASEITKNQGPGAAPPLDLTVSSLASCALQTSSMSSSSSSSDTTANRCWLENTFITPATNSHEVTESEADPEKSAYWKFPSMSTSSFSSDTTANRRTQATDYSQLTNMSSDSIDIWNLSSLIARYKEKFDPSDMSDILATIEEYSPEKLSIQDKDGNTLLHKVIEFEFPFQEITSALIAKLPGKLLSKQNDWGMTPLHLAIKHRLGNDAVLKLVEKLKPEQLSLQNYLRETPLHLAIQGNLSPEVALKLIQKLSVEQLSIQDRDGNTPLHKLIQRGILDVSDNLLNGWLHLALQKGLKQIRLALVEKLNPEQLAKQNLSGRTPLHEAIYEELRKWDDGSLRGIRSLHKDFEFELIEIASDLIKKLSAEQLSIQDDAENTPLIAASQHRYTRKIKDLLQQKLLGDFIETQPSQYLQHPPVISDNKEEYSG